jgi:two-component system sensor histidine kinase UhpB
MWSRRAHRHAGFLAPRQLVSSARRRQPAHPVTGAARLDVPAPPTAPVRPATGRRRPIRLAERIVLANSFVLVVAAALLAATPFGLSYPPRGKELLALGVGVIVMIVLDGVLVHRALRPIDELRASMRRIDPLVPGERLDEERASDLIELARGFNDMADRLEAERRVAARRAVAGREEERRALARELHDEVGQTLTAVLAHVDAIARLAPPGLDEAVAGCREGARAALEQVRRVVTRLRPDTLEDLGLGSALRAMSARVGRQFGLRVTLHVDERLPPLNADAELAVYRVAQEAMTNAARHARASEVVLRLGMDDGGLVLRVRDDGCGVRDRIAGTSGIRGMQERALLVGGTVRVGAPAGGGTEVVLRIPTLEAHA